MYAVIKTGGKQYKVQPGQVVRVEKIEAQVGDEVTLAEVLLVSDGESVKAGNPLLAGAKVSATVLEQDRATKIKIFKKKRRQGYHKAQGHRQYYTALKIKEITL